MRMLSGLFVLLCSAACAEVIPASSISARASSEFFGSVTGAGLTIDGSEMIGDLHSNASNGAGMWLSASGGGGNAANNPAGVAGPAWLHYTFDGATRLDSVWVWNHNQASLTDRGLRNVSIRARRNTNDAWQLLGNYELTRAPGTPGYAHGDEIDLGGVTARELLITASSTAGNYGSAYYGLSELRFFGESFGCWPADHPLRLTSATPDPAYNQMLAAQPVGWLGSDLAKSIDLENGTSLWLFGDTFIGRLENGARAPGAKFINNSVGIQDRGQTPPAGMTYYWGPGDTSMFPHVAGTPGAFYWPTMGVYYRGEVFLYCYSVDSGFNFGNTTLIRISNPHDIPSSWKWTATDFGLGGANLSFHTAMFVEEPYIYMYGFERTGGTDHAVLARMNGDDLVAGGLAGALEYWVNGTSGPQWSASRTNLVHLFSPTTTESDIQFLPEVGLYVTTSYNTADNTIYLLSAPSLTGPWSEQVCLYDIPEYDEVDFDIIAYAARFHPELSTMPGEIFMTYATNTPGTFTPLFTPEGLNTYVPKMVRLTIAPPARNAWELF